MAKRPRSVGPSAAPLVDEVEKESMETVPQVDEGISSQILMQEAEGVKEAGTGGASKLFAEMPTGSVQAEATPSDDELLAEQFILKKRKRADQSRQKLKGKMTQEQVDAEDCEAVAKEMGCSVEEIEKVKLIWAEAELRGISYEECESLILQEEEELKMKQAQLEKRDEELAKNIAKKDLTQAEGTKKGLTVKDSQAGAILEFEKAKSSQPASASRAWDKIDTQRLTEVVQKRFKEEKITQVQIRKRKNKSTPTLVITRGSDQTCGEVLELEDLSVLGYAEWLEVHGCVLKSKSTHRENVLKELFRRFEKVKRLNIDLSGLPSSVQTDERPLKRAKYLQDPPTVEKLNKLTPSELLDRLSGHGGVNDLSHLNLTPPPGVPQDKEGLFICDRVNHGLLYHNFHGGLCFQRTEELPVAPNVHLFTLNWICLRNPENSGSYNVHLIQEAKKRGIDLSRPESVIIKEELGFV